MQIRPSQKELEFGEAPGRLAGAGRRHFEDHLEGFGNFLGAGRASSPRVDALAAPCLSRASG